MISAGHRRENELKYLWGTEELSSIEQPRTDFRGVLVMSAETGVSKLVHKSVPMFYLKQLLSAIICLSFGVFTILCALGGQSIRYIQPKCMVEAENAGSYSESNGCSSILEEKQFELLSSVTNLTLIGVNGQIFYAIARNLTKWENHRTHSEVQNSLVAKNFVFQFINSMRIYTPLALHTAVALLCIAAFCESPPALNSACASNVVYCV
eukprot:SAG31_NODE_1196_length_9445_cov_9.153970_2_plen_209_part_00